MKELRVPIKEELRTAQPFDTYLPSNLITAIILSYIGKKSAVY